MYNDIINFLKNKKIAILGFGVEGQSTYRFIRKYLKEIPLTIINLEEVNDNLLLEGDNNLSFVYGTHYLETLEEYDVIMKSPGISFKELVLTNIKDKIFSQIELLLLFYSKNVIGITGTKGKSTVSTLIYQVLKEQNQDVYLVGNVGIPVFDEIDKFKENTKVVVEMSSHQLEFVKHSPHIGVILNLFEDHLDHAGSVEHYHEIKMHMFKYQTKDDISIFCSDNDTLNNKVLSNNYHSKLYPIQLEYNQDKTSLFDNKVMYQDKTLYIDDNKRNILGKHNLENIMAVIMITHLLNFDLIKAKETIDLFNGLEHRLEFVGEIEEVKYYNDTIATIPEATIGGIEALGQVNTLIFGGMDRGINYTEFIDYLRKSNIEYLICMPDTGHIIGKQLLEYKSDKELIFVETLEEAVKMAKTVTKKGMICLLSPAASSYGFFKNFQDKGEQYKKLVLKQ